MMILIRLKNSFRNHNLMELQVLFNGCKQLTYRNRMKVSHGCYRGSAKVQIP